ncbi:MAG: hypothetical protein JWM78_3639 [Verrucomicrobiaceae bacterium]|nr:hypothetical protein [Verrucomicrobiaceae bacterium]
MTVAMWYWIVATRMKRMAARESATSKPDSAKSAVRTDSLGGVFGTTGIKAAAHAEKRTDAPAIGLDQRKEQPAEHVLLLRLFARFALQLSPQVCKQFMQSGII